MHSASSHYCYSIASDINIIYAFHFIIIKTIYVTTSKGTHDEGVDHTNISKTNT